MSSYSEGQVHQLVDRLEAEGFTPADLTQLGQFGNLAGIKAVVHGQAKIVPVTPKLLEPVTTVEVEGTERFIAADHFVVGRTGIAWLGENFKKLFLGKVETDVQPATLRVHRLTEASLDAPIRAELGADREEIALAHFRAALNRLPVGSWVIAYIRGTDGNLCAVFAPRHGGGWDVDALSVTHPRRWAAGYQIFSR